MLLHGVLWGLLTGSGRGARHTNPYIIGNVLETVRLTVPVAAESKDFENLDPKAGSFIRDKDIFTQIYAITKQSSSTRLRNLKCALDGGADALLKLPLKPPCLQRVHPHVS